MCKNHTICRSSRSEVIVKKERDEEQLQEKVSKKRPRVHKREPLLQKTMPWRTD